MLPCRILLGVKGTMDRDFIIELIAYDTFKEASTAARDLATCYDTSVDVHELSTGRWSPRGPAAHVGLAAWLSEGPPENEEAEVKDPTRALQNAERLVEEANAAQREAFSLGRGPVCPDED